MELHYTFNEPIQMYFTVNYFVLYTWNHSFLFHSSIPSEKYLNNRYNYFKFKFYKFLKYFLFVLFDCIFTAA